MSKLQELINELCPDGVCHKNLGDFCKIQTGKGITSKDTIETGKYPVVSGGTEYMGYYNEYNREANTVTIARAGSAGYVNFINKKFYLNDKCFSIIPKDNTNTKYLYYVLKNMENDITAMKSTGSVPTVNTVKVSSISIPVPPLPVQEEIVRILDKMTDYVTELKAELKARKIQYEYYRDKTLYLDGDKITIQELFDIKNGFTPSKNNSEFWDNGTLPWFRLDDIKDKGRVLSDSYLHITQKALKKTGLFPKDSIIISTSATIGEYALITVPFLCNQRFTCMTVKSQYRDRVNIKYLMHYCPLLAKYCKEHLNKSSFASVDMKQFVKFEFVLPSIEEQNRIVSILDRFDFLCNNLTSGLPAEIEARQKQYERYRDKLLSFRKLENEEC